MRPWPARRLRLALLALVALGCGEPPPRPDVLLISLDSVRADVLTFLDSQTAPRLHALAQRGTVFTQAVAGSSWTLPSHAQLFVGAPPILHGVQADDMLLDPVVPTVPELLGEAGYATGGFHTAWYLAGRYGFARGFEVYVNAMTQGAELEDRLEQALREADRQRERAPVLDRDVAANRDITSPNLVKQARSRLPALSGERPLFLFAHLMDPHYDYIPPPPYDTLFDPDYDGPIDGRDLISNPLLWDEANRRRGPATDRDLEHVFALYRGEVAWTDRAIGELLDELAARRDLDRTLIIVTADHGDEFFEHGGLGHRQSLFDEVLRVPLLIVPPGGRQGTAPRICDQQVSLSDVLPTVLDYAGEPRPESCWGRSLRPLLEGEGLPERPIVSSLWMRAPARDGVPVHGLFESMRTASEKLVRVIDVPDEGRPLVRGVFLYDLESDPGEQRPLTDPADPRVGDAWERMEAELDRLRGHWRSVARTPPEERRTRLAEIVAPDLAALGYAGVPQSERPQWAAGPLGPLELPSGR
jgi:arylsulfatase A-like enzyme